ncbi:MAG TPA: caspase family protein [Cyclobacteriaceae bacterium]|nr:caspase family protein [Cyclobacteriaceae bacterium]
MLVTLVFVLIAAVVTAQNPQEKYALVIGVKSYEFVQPLANSLNDARDLSATLKSKGFHVIELYDPKSKRDMQDAVRKYFGLLQGKNNVAGMVFYSGHGMQVDGINYLIPAQANPQIKADLEDQCLSMDYVMRAIEEAGNGLNIFVLDACRNNPFRGFSRSGEKGLSMVNAPRGSYIVYATKPGSVASDGTGRNGLFTSKLLKHMNVDGLKFEEVFKRVAADVAAESADAQRPWISSDYTGDFYFSPGKAGATPAPREEPVVTKKEEPKQTQKTGGSILGKDINKNKEDAGTANASMAGVWQNTQFGTTLTLFLQEDGNGEFDGEMMKWSVANGKITMTTTGGERNVYNMNLQGNKMTFSGGDLDQPLVFTKYDSNAEPDTRSVTTTPQTTPTYGIDNNLLGVWSGNGETIEFKNNGQCIYLGQTYPYQTGQGMLSLSTIQGAISFYYQISNSQLILSANGNQVVYQKGNGGNAQMSNPNANRNSGGGSVPQELVGKWCWVNVTNTNSGGSSSDQCITLNGDGTYVYYSERSSSVNGGSFYGGTNSQNGDQGTWYVQGDRIFYNSQKSGQGSYRLEKRNHPRNVNDPMIVLDGQPFVTQYQKAPWR